MVSGLRERNIATAKTAIQAHALQLFAEQGYEQTTIEQIVDTAEVSASTFFRYFKTKEAVVLYDSIDPILIRAFLRQPATTPPIRAMRNAVKELNNLSVERRELELQRFKLLNAIPALQMRSLGEMTAGIDRFAATIAERTGRKHDDITVRNLAGAIIGVMAGTLQQAYKNPSMTLFEREMDVALAQLEKGLGLDQT